MRRRCDVGPLNCHLSDNYLESLESGGTDAGRQSVIRALALCIVDVLGVGEVRLQDGFQQGLDIRRIRILKGLGFERPCEECAKAGGRLYLAEPPKFLNDIVRVLQGRRLADPKSFATTREMSPEMIR